MDKVAWAVRKRGLERRIGLSLDDGAKPVCILELLGCVVLILNSFVLLGN
jgi:hypothetical protein